MRAAPVVDVAAGAACQNAAVACGAGRVDRPEAGRGEGGEHARVTGDSVGHALAAGQAASDDLPGVTLVDLRTAGADGFAPVAAADEQDAAGLGCGVVDRCSLAGGAVDGVDPASQADRVGAVPGADELLFPAVEVVTGRGLEKGSGGGSRPQAGFGPGGEGDGRDRHALVTSRTRVSARCLSGSGRIRVRLSLVSQLRAVRTWSRYSPAAWTSP